MITIYEYDLWLEDLSLSYLAATAQPLAGGCEDTEEGRLYSARILVPVHQVADLPEARRWIEQRLATRLPQGHVPGVTQPPYTVRERPHSQALLCITAEGATEDEAI